MSKSDRPNRRRRRVRPAIGPRLRPLLRVVLGLTALLAANGFYLIIVRLLGWTTGASFEDRLYLAMFLAHLALGLLLLVPILVFVAAHLSNALSRPNRRAVRAGLGLLAVLIVLLTSGIVLTRIEGILEVRDPTIRSFAYWAHVLSPLAAIWLFVLHRLAGPPLRWRNGKIWLGVTTAITGVLIVISAISSSSKHAITPADDLFSPSQARTSTGGHIPARLLATDDYCRECHADIHNRWSSSAHRQASFTNPAYRFAVERTRRIVSDRDGTVHAARLCAVCHDPVPLFSGRFDDPAFTADDPTASAGITCTACHAIESVDSPRGNGSYTLATPVHYPFSFSDSPSLRWINRQLIKAKPELHKKTFLKPVHRSAEFCSVCHKVHLPVELNGYRWLRGQNHYDSYLLSGVSGHGVASFYYPQQAVDRCAGCHMPPRPSTDFGAADFTGAGVLTVHDHLFVGANTALPRMVDAADAEDTIRAHQAFLDGAVRVDIFGIRTGGRLDGELMAPLRPKLPVLRPGSTYLLEIVIRTLGVGHLMTQGTSDSNQLWLDVSARSDGQVFARSGGMTADGAVDEWSHFVNAYVLDRDGRRIDRRNAEDVFVALYDHQIPPGAADVVHYRLKIPETLSAPIEINAALRYRKFDTTFLKHIYGNERVNDLPVTTLGEDRLVVPVISGEAPTADHPPAQEWERWNDYGIGLLRKPGQGELRQAEAAFRRVADLGRPDGHLNLARVYLREGRVAVEAPQALSRAQTTDPPPNAWTLLWLNGLVNQQNGRFDDAIRNFREILAGGFTQAAGRGFDFSLDYRLLNQLGTALYRRGLMERGDGRAAERTALLGEARQVFERTLELDPENLTAHWALKQIHNRLGNPDLATRHGDLHARYKLDDNARDRAITAARRHDPAADHAAEAVVLYDLHRRGAPELNHHGS